MRFFTEVQARDISALAERIFPASSESPGAEDILVVDYIDGQLAGDWGQGVGMYKQGPFHSPDHSGHGWQLPLTPAEAYVCGLTGLSRHCHTKFGGNFHDLPTIQQDAVINELAAGSLPNFGDLKASEFFQLIRQGVLEGLFSDPCYGGNHDLMGWKWVGYPGVASAHGDEYRQYIDKHDEVYSPEPRSLP